MQHFPDEEEDNFQDNRLQFDANEFTDFKVDGLNRMVDLTRDKFAYAADDFMQAVGEDNIFMSGFNWLAGTGTKEEKRKYVRFQIDEIFRQIFNMQTEIMQPRNLKIVNKVKKEYLIRLDHQ